jgi:hypothetical protein
MIGNSLVTQGIVLALALAVVFTYIKPILSEIGTRQDEIAQTKTELETITSVNSRLAELVKAVEAIPQVDKTALYAYIPDTVDEVQVLKDLSSMAAIVGVAVRNLSYEGEGKINEAAEDAAVKPIPHTFKISTAGSYEKLKQLLLFLEQNKYPLEVTTLVITPIEGGYLELELGIVTYSHK